MIPILFGSSERTLAGVFTPAAGGAKGTVAVFCPPLGQEQLRAHRTGRVLADSLARNGVDVLRFDYYGTGESTGAGEEISLQGCVADVVDAVREATELAGARSVTLLGFRLGALLATLALCEQAVDRLVLCDPILDGSAHDRELAALADDGVRGGGGLHVLGFPVPWRFREELAEQSPGVLPALPRRLLVLAVTERAEHPWLREEVEARGESAEFAMLDEEPYWVEADGIGVGTVPVGLLSRVTEWHP